MALKVFTRGRAGSTVIRETSIRTHVTRCAGVSANDQVGLVLPVTTMGAA